MPGFRPDLEVEVDAIEEIVRVHGYDRLPSTVPGVRVSGGEQDSYVLRRRVRALLMRCGLREAASLSFASPADVELMGHDAAIAVANPPSAAQPLLRTSLIPGLLTAVRRNLDLGARSVKLFEVGHVFRLGEPVDEREHVAVVLGGSSERASTPRVEQDVLDVKGVVEFLLDGLRVGWTLESPPSLRSTPVGRVSSRSPGGAPVCSSSTRSTRRASDSPVRWPSPSWTSPRSPPSQSP